MANLSIISVVDLSMIARHKWLLYSAKRVHFTGYTKQYINN